MIDLRSDTVTQPSKEMLDFMISCPTGDDVFNEDPTTVELQNFAAELFGKEAALFCSSGTQTNQLAINVHTTPGGEVICHYESHVFKYEGGGIARNSGVSVRTIDGNRGRIEAEKIKDWINPVHDVHYPLTQLVCIEDTSNRGGGAVYDFEEIKKIRALCSDHNLKLHLDGARVFNALAENKIPIKEYADPFDSISICLSKGLGAPIGSLLLGNKELIKKAHRVRKVLGGGMRQTGIIAGAGLFALKNNIDRIKMDHRNAKQLGETFLQQDYIKSLLSIETNIVVAQFKQSVYLDKFIAYLKENNILCMAFGKDLVRMVTHLDITPSDIQKTIQVINRFNP